MPGTTESSSALSSASGNGNLQSWHGDSGLSFPATQKANVGRSQAQSLPTEGFQGLPGKLSKTPSQNKNTKN